MKPSPTSAPTSAEAELIGVLAIQSRRPGHNAHMLAVIVGALMSSGTVLGLAWDWWRHPTL